MNPNPQNAPQKVSIEEVLKTAFHYWKSTLAFQLVVTVLYFSVILIAGLQLSFYYFGDKMQAFTPELLQTPELFRTKIAELVASENGQYFQIVISLIKAAMFPLGIGLFKVYSVLDQNKKPVFSDVLDGYSGSNFFKFWGFALFWNVVFQLGLSFFLLPGILWVLITLFVGPLLYFTPMRMIEAVSISGKVFVANWSLLFPCAAIAFLFSYAGSILFLVGFLFTFPFWYAVIYTLFKKYFNIKFV